MATIDMARLSQTVINEVASLFKTEMQKYAKELEADTREFIQSSAQDLQRWTDLLEKGEITQKDFEGLVKGRVDLMKVTALTKKGIAKIKLDKIKNEIFLIIINLLIKL